MYVCDDCIDILETYRFGRQVPYEFECDICGHFPSLGCELTNVVRKEDPNQLDMFGE